MNKERMTGFIMLALLIIITVVYFVFSGQVKTLEAENERLRDAIVEAEDTKKFSTTEDEIVEKESQTDSKQYHSEAELEKYNLFMETFIEEIFTNQDVDAQKEQLEQMTSEAAYQYLEENYYVLENAEASDYAHDHEADGKLTEGEYEAYELNSELNHIQTFYTATENSIETLTLFQLMTNAEEETFTGNFVIKGELTSDDENNIVFDSIESITSLNDPNSEALFIK